MNPDPAILLNVILSIGLLASVALNITNLVRSRTAQKREISFGAEIVERRDYELHRRENDKSHDALWDKFNGLNALLSEVRDDVAALKEGQRLREMTLAHMDLKIDRLLERKT